LSRHSVGALQKGFDALAARSSRIAAWAVTLSDQTTYRAGHGSAARVTPPYVESVEDHQLRLWHPPPCVPTSPPAAHKARTAVCRLAATGAAAATRIEARACSLHAPGQAPARGRATIGSGRCSAGSVARGRRRRGAPPTPASRPGRLRGLISHPPGHAATGSRLRRCGGPALVSPFKRLRRPRPPGTAEGRGRDPAAVLIASSTGFRRLASAAARREGTSGEGAAAGGSALLES
jgi:hypothetical protein